MQCGAACLAMICRHYGKKYSVATLSSLCPASAEGVSLLGISKTGEHIGFHSFFGKASIDQLIDIAQPCILHWRQNHFVVLYQIKNRKIFRVADPGKGLITYSLAEFKDHWISTVSNGADRGIVLFLQPTDAFYDRTDDSLNSQKSLSFLLGYITRYRGFLGQIVLGLFIGCILQLIFPFLTQSIVDVGITHKALDFIWLILLGQIMLTFSRATIDFLRRWLLLHISMRINISIVSDFFIKLLKLPMSFFDTKLMGDLLQRMQDHGRVERFMTNQMLSVAFSILSLAILGIVLLIYDKLIFGVFLTGSIAYGVWVSFFLNRRRVLDYELFEKQAKNNNYTYQFLTSIQEIKLQDCERRRRWEWEDVQTELFGTQMKNLKLQQTQEAGSIFINETKNIIITALSATAVINGHITLGMMLAIQYIIGQLNSPVEQMMNFIYSIQEVKIGLERINEIHKSQEEDNSSRKVLSFNDFQPSITANNIVFKYDRHALKNTIDNISFHIPEGKVTAIVGSSGSGKTTLIKLMLGYYPVNAGNILIGETDITGVNLKWWRRQCGVVMQDGIIFSESIARNIAVDDGKIDKERLLQSAMIANIHEYIMGLPLKYDTKIGPDGMGISQGQKQRILIARAVYKNPRYIFLDEATNALDAKNERIIVNNLNEYYMGRTVVVVAHRLSTVKTADQIVVLDAGKIVEEGKHSALIAKKGVYYHLVKNQLELGT